MRRKYLHLFLILLLIEIFIGLFIHDNFIRPYVGDVLVVLVMYYFVKALKPNCKCLPIYVFLIALFTEILQYFKIVEVLNIKNKVISIILGSTADVWDIVCYMAGTIILLCIENKHRNFK